MFNWKTYGSIFLIFLFHTPWGLFRPVFTCTRKINIFTSFQASQKNFHWAEFHKKWVSINQPLCLTIAIQTFWSSIVEEIPLRVRTIGGRGKVEKVLGMLPSSGGKVEKVWDTFLSDDDLELVFNCCLQDDILRKLKIIWIAHKKFGTISISH